MDSGKYATEDELLMDAMRALGEEAEDLAAIKEAIGAWRAGDEGLPLADAFQAIRNKTSMDAAE
jgi:hypothetical protein